MVSTSNSAPSNASRSCNVAALSSGRIGVARCVRMAPVSISEIQGVVCRKLAVKTADLQSKGRTKSLSKARQIGIYLARTMTNASQTDIGNAFGGRDHSTVSYAIDTMKDLLESDPSFRTFMEQLADEIRKSKL